MNKTKVLIVDDHDLVLMGMERFLEQHKEIEVVGIAKDGEEAILKTELYLPDVLILDIQIPKKSGIQVTEEVTNRFPNTKIILHSSFTDEKYIIQGFDSGAAGYVPKKFSPNQLLDAIRAVKEGKLYMKDFISEVYLNYCEKSSKSNIKNPTEQKVELTQREIDILELVTLGSTNQHIAEQLFISIRTVEVHKSNIMKKLNVHNIAELVVYSIKQGLIKI